MAWQIPWVISGVTEIPLDVARVMAYSATGGQEGVIGSTDLQVKQVATPTTSVTVGGGAFVCLNRYQSGTPQSYIGYNLGNITVPIVSAGATPRTDLVYAHIVDPGQTGGGSTAGPVETRVIQGVTSTVTQLNQVPGYANTAGLALARIAVPASGASITQAMITDLRALSQTKQADVVQVAAFASGSTERVVTSSWGAFPSEASWSVSVPAWATRMAVVGQVAGLEVRGTSGQPFAGAVRAKMGSQYSNTTDVNVTVTTGPRDTASTLVAGDRNVPTAERGTIQNFRLEAIKNSGAAGLYSQYGTVIVFNIKFYNGTEVS